MYCSRSDTSVEGKVCCDVIQVLPLISGCPMAQVSNVAMLPQHAMIGSAGGQETHAVYDYEVCPNEYASQGFVPTRIDEVPPRAVKQLHQ